jgi:hypothetical protein
MSDAAHPIGMSDCGGPMIKPEFGVIVVLPE